MGLLVGSYVEGNTLAILIDEKPMMIPCSAIESFFDVEINQAAVIILMTISFSNAAFDVLLQSLFLCF
jgi:hypothetical protein